MPPADTMTATDLWQHVFDPLEEMYGADVQVNVDYNPDMPSASFQVGSNLITLTVEPAPTPDSVEHCCVSFISTQEVTDHLLFNIETDTIDAFGVENIPYKREETMYSLMFFCEWQGQYIKAVKDILDIIIPVIELSRP